MPTGEVEIGDERWNHVFTMVVFKSPGVQCLPDSSAEIFMEGLRSAVGSATWSFNNVQGLPNEWDR